jgi:hypothetical protein
MDFELGYTMTLEGIVSIIVVATGNTVFLAISLPVLATTLVVNKLYWSISKQIR